MPSGKKSRRESGWTRREDATGVFARLLAYEPTFMVTSYRVELLKTAPFIRRFVVCTTETQAEEPHCIYSPV